MAAQNTYQYIDKAGKAATVQAADAASAMKTAGIASNSGVRLVSAAPTAQPSTQQTVQSTQQVATPQAQTPLSAGQQATSDAVARERAIAQAQGQSQPQYTASPSVSATSIGNTQPMSLPTTPGNTSSNTAAGVIGGAGGTNQVLQELQKQTEAAQIKAEKEQSTMDKLMGKYLGKGAATAQAEADAGVNELKSTAQALTQEYNTKTLSYNAQFQQIMQQPGLSIEQKNNQVAAITRNHAYEMTDLSIRQNIAQGNFQAAQEGVDKKIAIEYGDLKDLINFQSQVLSDAKSNLTDKEKTKLSLLNAENERKLAEITYQAHALQDVKTQMQIEASKNGASQATIAAIQSATTEGAAIAAAGKYVGLLDRQLQQAQLGKIYSDIKKASNAGVIDKQVNQLAQQAMPTSNREVISAILSGSAVSAGTKGRLAPANSVLNAVSEFADQRQTGEFVGVGIAGRLKEGIKGLFNAKNPQAIENQQNIDAINLKVQQWASGASLTEQQTKQVNKITPKTGDSDKEVRTKMSGLYNYMLNQVESDLLSDGVNINFAPVNLFESYESLKSASPEQLAELRKQGLIK